MSIPSIFRGKKLILCLILISSLLGLHALDSFRTKTILKSALIPGFGQLSIGKERGYIFLGNELLLISGLYYFKNESDVKLNKAYDIALHYAHIQPGNYSDDYLIKLGKYTTNGFDVNGYNTSIQQQAASLFPGDPQAQQDYFNHNMIPDSQGWTWDDNDSRQSYRKVRKESLDMKDYAKVVTGMLIANHLINVIDIARTTAHRKNVDVGFGIMPDFTPQLQVSVRY